MATKPPVNSTNETIAIGADHAGFMLKDALKAELLARGLQVIDTGTHTPDSVDYPDYAGKVADAITHGKAGTGLLVCGSGIGMSIAANRNPNIRCALCQTAEMATLARKHNDANVLALGARLVDTNTAIACLNAFLDTAFDGGRHAPRVAKLTTLSENLKPLETSC